jgi:integrase
LHRRFVVAGLSWLQILHAGERGLRADGGLELPLKVVHARLGHSTIAMTADVYGHLFPRTDDDAELTAAAGALVAVPA